jgi:hypothetical protein
LEKSDIIFKNKVDVNNNIIHLRRDAGDRKFLNDMRNSLLRRKLIFVN